MFTGPAVEGKSRVSQRVDLRVMSGRQWVEPVTADNRDDRATQRERHGKWGETGGSINVESNARGGTKL